MAQFSYKKTRRSAWLWGRQAEFLCKLSLWIRGYRILQCGMRLGRNGSGIGEVDIIARRGSIVAFIEVKARQNEQSALEALRPEQKRRIMKAAEIFLRRYPQHSSVQIRFDLMSVTPKKWPRHYTGAWTEADI